MNLTTYELDCIRFYMGDPEIVFRGDFQGGTKAYNTINALLHDGIVNELDKLKEGKPIEIYNTDHLRQTISLIQALDCAMEKMHCFSDAMSPTISYRIDRISEIEAMMSKRRIEGFYSTCKRGFLSEYAHTKQNVVLMVIEREADVPCLDFEHLFQDLYAKPQEAEILLPFDCEVKHIEKVSLTNKEKQEFYDMHGNPPCGKYRIVLGRRKRKGSCCNDALIKELTSHHNAERISACLRILTKKNELNTEDLAFYLAWKNRLKAAVE